MGVVPSFLLVFKGVVVCNGCLGLALTHFAQHEISLNCIRNKLVLFTSFLTVKKKKCGISYALWETDVK